MKKENFNYENFNGDNMNDIKYKQLYKMMILNNIYYQRIAYMNNFIQNYNYNMINNIQNIPNQSTNKPHKNNNSNKSNPYKKTKKFIDKRYLINLMDIKTNKEQRTTVRMMNIPSYFRPLDLAKKLDEKLGISPQKENRVYDFIYIPFKESKKNERLINAGYAFINFVHPKHILQFYSFFHGKHLKLTLKSNNNYYVNAIGYNLGYLAEDYKIGDKIDVAGNLEINAFNGVDSIQINLKDLMKSI